VFGSSNSTRANTRAVFDHASRRTLRDLAAAIISVAKIRFEHFPVSSGATSTGTVPTPPIRDALVLVVAMVREMSIPYALSHAEPNCCSVHRRAEYVFVVSARRVHRL